MNLAYFEMIGGASGNMLLGALIDAGADVAAIEAALRTLPVEGWSIECRRVEKRQLAATYFDFVIPGEDHHPAAHDTAPRHGRHLSEVLALLERSELASSVKERARAIYLRLAEAEAKMHGTTVDRIHFHEVGATDAILDVAGTLVALDALGVDAVACGPFPVGRGTIDMEHGRYPNPPPTTVELLRGAPTFDGGIEGEMVTPTGAAILTSLVARPGLRPAMTAQRVGYGAGRSEFAIPNVTRVSIGSEAGQSGAGDEVAVLEANIDDMSPQHYELAIERVLAAGAFDVWLAPVTMKKLRPAIVFGAVAPLAREADVAKAMLTETSTLGVRVRHDRRYVLERHVTEQTTPLGTVRVKTAIVDGQARRTLEYDDVARIARERNRPIAEIAAALGEHLPHL